MLRAAVFGLFALATSAIADPRSAGFNPDGVLWHDLESGLATAKAEGKPILLVVHTEWCADCKIYKQRFFDARVEAASREIVFVLIDQDKEPEAAAAYAPDGFYIPRTLVLTSDGTHVPEIRAWRSDYRYFLDPTTLFPLLRVIEHAKTLN